MLRLPEIANTSKEPKRGATGRGPPAPCFAAKHDTCYQRASQIPKTELFSFSILFSSDVAFKLEKKTLKALKEFTGALKVLNVRVWMLLRF